MVLAAFVCASLSTAAGASEARPGSTGAGGLGASSSSTSAGALGARLLWTAATAPVLHGPDLSAVRDVSGDGVSELLVAECGLRRPADVLLLDGATGNELWRRRFEDPPTPPGVWADLDRGPCVLVASRKALSVLDARTGRVVREVELRAPIGEIIAARLTEGGAAGVVYSAGVERDDLLVALAGDGFSELWTARAEPDDGRFGEGFTDLVALDFDGDGADEIVVNENMRWVVAFSADGSPRWRRELGERTKYVPKGGVSGRPVLGDFLGGGGTQLAVGLWAGTLVVVDPMDGEVLAQHLFGAGAEGHGRLARSRRLPKFLRAIILECGEPINDLVAVDLDGASGLEVVFGCSDGYVYAYAPRSDRVLWNHDSGGNVYRPPVPVDVNWDGAPDVIAWDDEGVYLIDGPTGNRLDASPPGQGLLDAVLADLDRDGTVELVEIGQDGSVRAFATGIECARAPGAPGCTR